MIDAHLPRVSLIIRSVGRDELAEALSSAGAQTHPAVEIIVVDATGGAHPPVPASAGIHPIVFVPGASRRSRPVAANTGLDAASGDYLGFLDDDDLLLPTHVEGLVAVLETDPACALAFSAAQETWPGGETRHVGNARVSRLTLHEACMFPPCAALFRRQLVAHCRFDETLDACEDWDFWLQVARRTSFRYLPRETAIYRADRGQSAMTAGSGGEAGRWHAAVLAKWAHEREALINEVEALFERALERAGCRDTEGAVALAAATLAAYPYHVGALNLRGTLAAMHGDFASAALDYQAAVEAAPEDPASQFNLAQAEERLGRSAQASARYRRVLLLDPVHPQARLRLAATEPILPTSQ